MTEAARIATAMDLHICVGSDPTDVEKQRTFWTIYVLEKEFCFLAARVSVSDIILIIMKINLT